MINSARDRRSVCLNEQGRAALLGALKGKFADYPAVKKYQWESVASLPDRRTVEKMLELGAHVRQERIENTFRSLGVAFDENLHLEPDTLPEGLMSSPTGQDLATGTGGEAPSAVENLRLTDRTEVGNGDVRRDDVLRVTEVPIAGRPPRRAAIAIAIAIVIAIAAAGGLGWFNRAHPSSGAVATSMQVPDLPTERRIVLYDDFRRDRVLDTDLWAVNGPAAAACLTHMTSSQPGTIVSPSLAFSGEDGLGIAGTRGEAGIQSSASFQPPFTVTAECMAADSRDAALQVGLSNETGSTGICIAGGLDAAGDYSGFTAAGTSGGGWQPLGVLSPIPPEYEVWYTLAVSVDRNGLATAAVSSGDQILGQTTLKIGSGPFHVVLGQRTGVGTTTEPDYSYYVAVQVITGAAE
ncbi:MAG: hypothetical protein ACLQVD_15050 [Capsulimonadaceae bacterium]